MTVLEIDAEAWQRSWDRQQESYMPDREERITALLDTVEAVVGTSPRILDLAGGTATVSLRAAARFPGATTTVLDVDDALLGIAVASIAARGFEDRIEVVQADLADPSWVEAVDGPYDAVLTATALHWLPEARLAAVYVEARGVLRDPGVLVNVDHHEDDGLPTLSPLLRDRSRRVREAQQEQDRSLEWSGWWRTVRADPALAPLAARRDARFAADHAAEFVPGMAWHLQALRDAGFREVGLVWRGLTDAAVAGLR